MPCGACKKRVEDFQKRHAEALKAQQLRFAQKKEQKEQKEQAKPILPLESPRIIPNKNAEVIKPAIPTPEILPKQSIPELIKPPASKLIKNTDKKFRIMTRAERIKIRNDNIKAYQDKLKKLGGKSV